MKICGKYTFFAVSISATLRSMTASNKAYFPENSSEAQRLAFKVNPTDVVGRYIAPLCSSPRRILDLGCGPGNITGKLAEFYPQAEVIGVDLSAERIGFAKEANHKLTNCQFETGDATKLRFAEGHFDLVFSRFMVEYFADPLPAIREMARVAAPGAPVIVQDVDSLYDFNEPLTGWPQKEVEAVYSFLRTHFGFDRHVGRKLFRFFGEAGLKNPALNIEGYNVFAGKISPKDREIKLQEFAAISVPLKQANIGIDIDALVEKILAYFDREDSLSFSLLVTASGFKPAT